MQIKRDWDGQIIKTERGKCRKKSIATHTPASRSLSHFCLFPYALHLHTFCYHSLSLSSTLACFFSVSLFRSLSLNETVYKKNKLHSLASDSKQEKGRGIYENNIPSANHTHTHIHTHSSIDGSKTVPMRYQCHSGDTGNMRVSYGSA